MKTGLATAPGGMIERSGVKPDIVCLAKALGGGLPCGAIGGTEELMGLIVDGSYDQVGTFNGNPLTMAAARATLLEVLDARCVPALRRVARGDGRRCARRPAAVRPARLRRARYGAKGAVVFSDSRLHDYREFLAYDARWGHAHWLFQHNGGVYLPPWGKCEQWTISAQHTVADANRFVANLESFARAFRFAR